MENGEWRMENGVNGEWRIRNGVTHTACVEAMRGSRHLGGIVSRRSV
jgi:hypothetical protein